MKSPKSKTVRAHAKLVRADDQPASESLKIETPEAPGAHTHHSAIAVTQEITHAIELSTRRICQTLDKVTLAIQSLLPPLTSLEWHVSHMHAKIDTLVARTPYARVVMPADVESEQLPPEKTALPKPEE